MHSSQLKAFLLLVVVVVPGQSKPVTGDVVVNGWQQVEDGLDDFGAGRSGSGFNVNGPGLVREAFQ